MNRIMMLPDGPATFNLSRDIVWLGLVTGDHESTDESSNHTFGLDRSRQCNALEFTAKEHQPVHG